MKNAMRTLILLCTLLLVVGTAGARPGRIWIYQWYLDEFVGGAKGDLTGDQTVDLDDFLIVKRYFGTWAWQGDVTGDEWTDLDDLMVIKQNFGRHSDLPVLWVDIDDDEIVAGGYGFYAEFPLGDADRSGFVDLADFVILKRNFGSARNYPWTNGDTTGDEWVNLDDFVLLKQNFGASVIPEPSSVLMILTGAIAILRAHRTRRGSGGRDLR